MGGGAGAARGVSLSARAGTSCSHWAASRRPSDGRWIAPIGFFPALGRLGRAALCAGRRFGPVAPQVPSGVVLTPHFRPQEGLAGIFPSGGGPVPTSAGAFGPRPTWATTWPAELVAWAQRTWAQRPLDHQVWARVLAGDPDRDFITAFIRDGIRVLGGHAPAAASAPSVTVASGMHVPSYMGRNRWGGIGVGRRSSGPPSRLTCGVSWRLGVSCGRRLAMHHVMYIRCGRCPSAVDLMA